MCHNYIGINYIGHNYIYHNYIGHDYTDHNYTGHSYIGHIYIGLDDVGLNCTGHSIPVLTTIVTMSTVTCARMRTCKTHIRLRTRTDVFTDMRIG